MLRLEQAEVEHLLGDWQVLNDELTSLTLPDVIELLKVEMSGRRRQSFIARLHGRITRLRNIAERSQLFNGNWPGSIAHAAEN